MAEELKQAAQQALEVLKSATSFMSKKARDQHPKTVARLERALTAAQPAQAGERKAFIHWMTATYPKVYNEYDAASYWKNGHVSALAWQARASLPTQPAAQATPEPVGEVRIAHYGGRSRSIGFSTIALFVDIETLPVGTKLYTHPAPGVPDVEDLRDRLVAISAAVADSDDRAAQAMLGEILRALAAAQAKGGE